MSLLSTKQAAEMLCMSPRTLRGHVKDGAIRYIVTGRGKKRPGICFDPIDLQEFIDRDKPPPAPAIKPRRPIGEQKVYFIRAGHTVKIGVAVNPTSRLSTLQVARHDKLELLLVLPGGAELERQLHGRFHALALSGEWFRYEGRIKIFVERKLELAQR